MKIFKLILQENFLESILTFLLFSILITLISEKLPKSIYTTNNWLLRLRSWEKQGRIYQELFHVKAWKKSIPELSDFVKWVFPKKHIREFTNEYLQQYLFESCKSEITHWLIIFSSLLFYLWCESNLATLMFLIAVILNMPYIIIQRYNRPRIMGMVSSASQHGGKVLV